jgi:hypothetical protein
MMQSCRHIRTTILFGLIGGLSFIPANIMLGYAFAWPGASRLTLWLLVAAYGLLLVRWGKKRPTLLFFPLFLLFLSVFAVRSTGHFFIFALVTFGWIRSGISFNLSFGKLLVFETLLCQGGGLLIALLSNDSAASWAIGVWMFFLIQALYFVIVDTSGDTADGSTTVDSFDQARAGAERILEEGFQGSRVLRFE